MNINEKSIFKIHFHGFFLSGFPKTRLVNDIVLIIRQLGRDQRNLQGVQQGRRWFDQRGGAASRDEQPGGGNDRGGGGGDDQSGWARPSCQL